MSTIEHVIYENDDNNIRFCLECNVAIDPETVYCDKCFESLEKSGFFADPDIEDDPFFEEREF